MTHSWLIGEEPPNRAATWATVCLSTTRAVMIRRATDTRSITTRQPVAGDLTHDVADVLTHDTTSAVAVVLAQSAPTSARSSRRGNTLRIVASAMMSMMTSAMMNRVVPR